MNRREFLKAAGAAGALPLFNIGCAGFGRSRAAQLADGAKIRIAVLGGNWGKTLLNRAGVVGGCELVALCDPDPAAIRAFRKDCAKVWGAAALEAAKTYADYRVMFDEVGDTLDAVFVATPNHHHALPTLLALRHGANVFVEKPMAHTMEEVLLIEQAAKRTGAVVRVGNKGHNMTHRPTLAKYLRDGVIGEVTEVFSRRSKITTTLNGIFESCPML